MGQRLRSVDSHRKRRNGLDNKLRRRAHAVKRKQRGVSRVERITGLKPITVPVRDAFEARLAVYVLRFSD